MQGIEFLTFSELLIHVVDLMKKIKRLFYPFETNIVI